MGIQRGRHPDHLPPATGPEIQRRLAAHGGELPLRRRAHLRPGDGRRVSVDPLRDRRLRGVRRALAPTTEGNAVEFTPEEYEAARRRSASRRVDDLTLQLDLTNPAPYFHTSPHSGSSSRSSRRSWTDPDNWWKTAENHIGNGPFTVTGIAEDQEWTFAANDNYWQGRPCSMASTTSMSTSRGRPRGLPRRRPRHRRSSSRRRSPRWRPTPSCPKPFVTYPQAATYILAMNLTQEPFTDKKVREAFAYAIDRETLCAEVSLRRLRPDALLHPGRASRRRSTPISTRSIPRRPCRRWPNRRTAGRRTCRRSSIFFNSDISGASRSSRSGLPARSATSWASSSLSSRWTARH